MRERACVVADAAHRADAAESAECIEIRRLSWIVSTPQSSPGSQAEDSL